MRTDNSIKAKRTMGRKCDGCKKSIGNKGGLFSTCNVCRAKGCKHEHIHYDSALNSICDGCGSVLKRMKLPFVRIPDADKEAVVAMLSQGKSVSAISKKTKVLERTIDRVKNGTYKSKKNIIGCC